MSSNIIPLFPDRDAQVLDLTPRLGVPIAADETPDEAFSTAYFRAKQRGEVIDFPHWFGGLGGGDAA